MDRRETIKALLISGVAGTAVIAMPGCETNEQAPTVPSASDKPLYGRTPAEKAYDERLFNQPSIFTKEELETIAILCDIILPATATAGSATDAEVPEFIDFIVKDMPTHQLPLKGGLMWLDREATMRYGQAFRLLSTNQQIAIMDDIAYPEQAKPEMSQGVAFFNRMRNLTLTGYYTSKMGIADLGYKGNQPNIWDGVPEEVLAKHGLAYEPEWLAKCVDQSKRMVTASWDLDGNLLT